MFCKHFCYVAYISFQHVYAIVFIYDLSSHKQNILYIFPFSRASLNLRFLRLNTISFRYIYIYRVRFTCLIELKYKLNIETTRMYTVEC